jgi:ubiquinone/menaquinone biosynthesis C-methylase UbiE
MDRQLRVNYDQLAPTYDHRFQDGNPDGTKAALLNLCAQIHPEKVLEIACGTGHWLEVIETAYPQIQVIGLDRSSGMLMQGRQRKSDLKLIRGKAEAFPLPDRSLDLVFCVNAFHHFDDKQQCIREASRVLRQGGKLAVIGSNPRSPEERWYIYQYFPETYALDLKRFLPWDLIADWMEQAGFSSPRLESTAVIRRCMYGDQIWQDPFLSKHSCSQLALLSQEEYEAGLRRIRETLDGAGPERDALLFRADIHMEMLSAQR